MRRAKRARSPVKARLFLGLFLGAVRKATGLVPIKGGNVTSAGAGAGCWSGEEVAGCPPAGGAVPGCVLQHRMGPAGGPVPAPRG